MKAFYIKAVVVFLLTTSCQSYKNINKINPKSNSITLNDELFKLVPGDKIRLSKKTGETVVMKFTEASAYQLRGISSGKDDIVVVNIDEISKVEVKKVNALQTLALLPLIPAIFVVTFLVALSRGGF
jgi:hypothetical protein